MTKHSIEELIYHMLGATHLAATDWDRGFAASIVRQSKWRNWKPSKKQEETMQRIVDEMFRVGRNNGEKTQTILDG